MARIEVRQRRKMRIRKKVSGTIERPRLCVFRSLKHVFVQAIDDRSGQTLASASSLCKELAQGESECSKSDTAFKVGKLIAERCKAKGISSVVFDRGGNLYHGRVAKVAAGARDGGLNF